MTPDKLRKWLERNAISGATLQLSHTSVEGGETVFQRWSCDSLPENTVQAIFDCCGEYADSIEETARCTIAIVDGDGEVIASQVHKAKPEVVTGWDAANAGNISQNTVVSQLLRHIEVQQRVLSGSNLGAFRVLSETLNLQQKINERLTSQLAAVTDKLVELQTALTARVGAEDEDDGESIVPAAQTAEESRARARALDRVSELLPVAAEGAIRYFIGKASGHDVAGGEVYEAAAAAAAEASG